MTEMATAPYLIVVLFLSSPNDTSVSGLVYNRFFELNGHFDFFRFRFTACHHPLEPYLDIIEYKDIHGEEQKDEGRSYHDAVRQ